MAGVTIDFSDLEALLFTAGAAMADPEVRKKIKRNSQFEQVEDRISDAVKRAGDAWRKAGRAKECPERFQIKETEIFYLQHLEQLGASDRRGIVVPPTMPRSYITKGLVELGVWRETIIWANSGEANHEYVERRARLTGDAAEILAQLYKGTIGSRKAVEDAIESSKTGGSGKWE